MLTLFSALVISVNFVSCFGNEYIRFHPKDTSIPDRPNWPKQYLMQGTLHLPYAELSEPFTVWYDEIGGRSRIDFYGGMTQTVQRADLGAYGEHYMIAPITNEVVKNQKNCFMYSGGENYRVKIQSILPDVSNFTFIGEKDYMGAVVQEWQLKYHRGQRDNIYTLYVDTMSTVPVYYEMKGFDRLLGSHYDIYKVEYGLYSKQLSDGVFDVPMKGMKCHGFGEPNSEEQIKMNPMREFIHPVDDSHLHHMYKDFLQKYNKKDDGHEEILTKKKNAFNHNLRYINSMNRKNNSFKLKVNHLADLSPEELRHRTGRRTTPFAKRKGNTGKIFMSASNGVPEEMNWRLLGAVTPVKDQAVCGSCWSFGATGTMEGTYFLKTGNQIILSEQNLVDCSWGFGNNGCDGGEEYRSYQYIMKHGLTSDFSYGNYIGVDGFCHSDKLPSVINVTSYVRVPSGDIDALKVAIAKNGPVAVGIDASLRSFSFYSHGVFYDPKCGNKPENLDHAVLAVGYGKMNGEGYWLVKNSWSTHWGNDGYILMSQKNNNCGVATDASFVNLD